jgi:nitrogen PTS system EIIA component
MNSITKLLRPSRVLLDLDVASKKRVFEQAGLLFENCFEISRSVVFDSLFSRERLGSTALGYGIAIPHGRVKGMREAAGAFVRTKNPIPFDAPDGKPVTLIFVVLVPEHATEQHLQILSELAQFFSQESTREALQSAATAEEAHKLLTEWSPPYAPSQRTPALQR